MKADRRNFIKKAAAAGMAMVAAPAAWAAEGKGKAPAYAATPFKLKYAPYMDMFTEHAGKDPVDNITFCHDQGFRAMFDNGLIGRPKEEQEKIMNQLRKFDMDLGPFVLYADFSVTSFVLNKPEVRDMLAEKMKQGVELAKRTGAKWALVVPG